MTDHIIAFAKCRVCRDEWIDIVVYAEPLPVIECPCCGQKRGEIFTSFERAREAMPVRRRFRLVPRPLAFVRELPSPFEPRPAG